MPKNQKVRGTGVFVQRGRGGFANRSMRPLVKLATAIMDGARLEGRRDSP